MVGGGGGCGGGGGERAKRKGHSHLWICVRKGDIALLAKYTMAVKLDFSGCDQLTGEFLADLY